MIPSQTYKVIGGDAAIKAAERHDPVAEYVVMGVELNDLVDAFQPHGKCT